MADLQMHVCKNDERLESVKRLFQKMGAKEDEINVEKLGKVRNLIVTKKGNTDEVVIVGAHYDKASEGCGTIDNWTGIVVIANLYRALQNVPTEKTYLFVAFDKEETGLLGSAAMAGAIPKGKRPGYCAMVNFDSFGLAYPQVLTNTSSPKMSKFAKDVAESVKMPYHEASLAGAAEADSTSFVGKDIPAITFHGLSNDWQKYLHSARDKIENIKLSSVVIGYRFGLVHLKRLDPLPCGYFRK